MNDDATMTHEPTSVHHISVYVYSLSYTVQFVSYPTRSCILNLNVVYFSDGKLASQQETVTICLVVLVRWFL